MSKGPQRASAWCGLAVAAALILGSAPAGAQSSDIEEVVVTAQKRSERLLDVPASVTALDGETIANRHLSDPADLAGYVPTLQMPQSFGSGNLYIRGIGNSFVDLGTDPSIAMYQDDAYISRPRAQSTAFYDIQRIEVLSGPQGTLYGRNATGGAINVLTRTPTDHLAADMRVSTGDLGLWRAEGGLGGPLAEGLRLRVAGLLSQHKGYGTNLYTGQDIDNDHEYATRAKLEWDAASALRIGLQFDYSRARDRAPGVTVFNLGVDPAANPHVALTNALRAAAGLSPFVPGADQPILGGRGDFWDISSDVTPTRNDRTFAVVNNIYFTASDTASFRLINSYRNTDNRGTFDLDASSARVGALESDEHSRFWSSELQFNWNRGRHHVLLGTYYFSEKIDAENYVPFYNDPAFPDPKASELFFSADHPGEIRSRGVAVFSNYTLDLTEKLALVLGGRYSHEKKESDGLDFLAVPSVARFIGLPYQDVFNPAVPTPRIPLSDQVCHHERSWNSADPRAVLRYEFNRDINAYVSWQKGFKSGGQAVGICSPFYNPEHITSYEIGIKAETPDRRIRVSLAAYRYHYDDLQVTVTDTFQGTKILNAASAKLHGAEADVQAQLDHGTSLSLVYGYLSTEFGDFVTADPFLPLGSPLRNLRGNQLPEAPGSSVSVVAGQDFRVSAGKWCFELDYRFTGAEFFTPFNRSISRQGGYGIWGSRASFEFASKPVSVMLWGKNLSNKQAMTSGYEGYVPLGAPIFGYPLPPRTYGADVVVSF